MTGIESVRTRQIERVLSFYATDFTKYLALTIALTEKLPEEINNSIRDAFTHTVRASHSTTEQSVVHEATLAIRHIERANRDCLKACIIVSRAELQELILDAVFYHGFLTPSIRMSHDNLKERRQQAYVAETQGDDNQVAKLEEILRHTLELSDQIREQYQVVGKRRTRVLRFFARWFRPIGFLVFTLLGAIIGFAAKSAVDQLLTDFLSH